MQRPAVSPLLGGQDPMGPRILPEINVENISINRANEVKYLGIYLGEQLTWRPHVNFVCKSLLKFFGIFNKIKFFVTNKLSRQLYFAFVHSRIKYSIEVYGSCSQNLISKIQVIQNKLFFS